MAEAGKDSIRQACELVGRFFYRFSKVENQLDAAIAKLFDLDEERAPILTANIDFSRKLNLVKTAAWQHAGKPDKLPKELHELFSALAQENDARVVLAHSSFEPEKDGIRFVRTTAKGKLNQTDETWAGQKFTTHFETLERLEVDVQRLIGELKPEEITWPAVSDLTVIRPDLFAEVNEFYQNVLSTVKPSE